MNLALFALFLASAQPALPDRLANPGFEADAPDEGLYGGVSPRGWSVHPARGYRADVVGSPVSGGVRPYAGRGQLFMGYFARSGPDEDSWIGIHQTIDARRWRGRRIRVSVAAYPAHFAADRAWLTVKAGAVTHRRGFGQVEQWRRYAVEIDIPQDAASLTVEIGTDGDVNVDDVRVETIRR